MKKAVVVGTGAGGATAAKELQGKFDVKILEAGQEFRRFSHDLSSIERLKRAGLLFDEREIQLLFSPMKIRKTRDRMVLVSGMATGGTTTIATGNAVRMDMGLKELGINLDEEFSELYRQVPVSTEHQKLWSEPTKRLFQICQEMGLHPEPMPKMGNYGHCHACGRCILGCPWGVKWDSRQFLREAMENGARLITRCRVERFATDDGRALGVYAKMGFSRAFFPADLIVLAAGGFATPVILENSGVSCEPRLFVDPVLCTAAEWKGALQNNEILMPFFVKHEHIVISPYFDILSYLFNRRWKPKRENTLSMMVKLADTESGSVSKRKVNKTLTSLDRDRLTEGVGICTEILERFGIAKETIFLGTINAGHPGGTLPLTSLEAASFHSPKLPENVYVSDSTLFPHALGNPPIMTIMAMAKRVSKTCIEKFG
jgi:choline dehydrogenase-like flavoprotein